MTHKTSTPVLRFPEFRDEWTSQPLGRMAEVIMGQSPAGDSYNVEGVGYPLINGPAEFTERFPVKIKWTDNATKFCKPDDILFCVRGSTTGRINIADDVYCIGRGVAAIRATARSSAQFIELTLSKYLSGMLRLATGSTFFSVDAKVLKQFSIPFPSLREQQKISAFMSALGERIGQLATRKELLLKYKKVVTRQIFDQEIRFKDERGKDFPNWEVTPLGDKTVWASGGTPAKDVSEYWNGDIPWISASSMRGSAYSDSDLKITSKGLKNGSRLAPKGSLLILVRGSMLHKSVPIGIATRDLAFNQDVKSIECINGLSPQFLLYVFVYSQNRLLNMVASTGIGAGKIDLNDLKNMLVSVPTPDEQNEISAFLSAVDQGIDLVSKQLELTKKFKTGLLQQMFV